MNRNWIVLVLALVSLASCSVEKRVYQPGYHIEWKHFASQDASQDAERDDSENLFQDVSQGRSEGVFQDAEQGRSEGASRNSSQDLPQDLSENLEIDAMQDASQDLSENLSMNLETDAMQDVSQGRSEGASQDLSENQGLSKNDVSGLKLILFVLLAVFVPVLAIFLVEGFSKNFWLSLLLMILAFALPLPLFLRGVIQLIAIILALAVVFHYV
jgi:uncharacterized membrane protein YqaE (UPF0057 family)